MMQKYKEFTIHSPTWKHPNGQIQKMFGNINTLFRIKKY